MASLIPRFTPAPVVAASAPDGDAERRDCRTCAMRDRCITYGWRSPAGLWFENAVVLRPPPGCRGYVGRSADIFGHFGDIADTVPRRGR